MSIQVTPDFQNLHPYAFWTAHGNGSIVLSAQLYECAILFPQI